jgi:hypothetical protein
MSRKARRPGDAATPPGQNLKACNQSILPDTTTKSPVIAIPKNVYDKLLKIAATTGIPAQVLGESAITRWVLSNWDHNNNRPLVEENL